MEISRVGVVGCGLMGSGIAEVCARANYQVVVSEATQELIQRGMERLRGSLERAVKAGKLGAPEKDGALAHLHPTTNLEDFRTCQIVIEAITEDLALKKQLFSKLDSLCPPGTIFASNTSCLSVTQMAMATRRPEQVVGMHFFNPAPILRLVELIKTIVLSPQTLETARAFAQSLSKTVIIVPDMPGFVVNRLLVPYMLDAIRLLEAGIASKEEIDQGMVLGCGYPMGPFVLLDMVGMDTVLYIADSMYQEFKDSKFAAPPLLRQMVAAGRLGRKTGRGFYEYK